MFTLILLSNPQQQQQYSVCFENCALLTPVQLTSWTNSTLRFQSCLSNLTPLSIGCFLFFTTNIVLFKYSFESTVIPGNTNTLIQGTVFLLSMNTKTLKLEFLFNFLGYIFRNVRYTVIQSLESLRSYSHMFVWVFINISQKGYMFLPPTLRQIPSADISAIKYLWNNSHAQNMQRVPCPIITAMREQGLLSVCKGCALNWIQMLGFFATVNKPLPIITIMAF